jgi:hypothetical protein
MLDLAVMHLARFLGKFLADIVGILEDVLAQFPELGAEFLFLRRHHRHRLDNGGGRRFVADRRG